MLLTPSNAAETLRDLGEHPKGASTSRVTLDRAAPSDGGLRKVWQVEPSLHVPAAPLSTTNSPDARAPKTGGGRDTRGEEGCTQTTHTHVIARGLSSGPRSAAHENAAAQRTKTQQPGAKRRVNCPENVPVRSKTRTHSCLPLHVSKHLPNLHEGARPVPSEALSCGL